MSINVLIFNCGSSSLSCQIFQYASTEDKDIKSIFSAKGHRVSTKSTEKPFIEYHLKPNQKDLIEQYDTLTHALACNKMLRFLHENQIKISFIGHRFVHSGGLFEESAFLSSDVYEKLKGCLNFAPIHNPAAISIIDECSGYYGKNGIEEVKQFVVFDTSFHSGIEPGYYTYAIDKNIAEKYKFRKFGFHGLSYQYVTEAVIRHLNSPTGKMIACHLGTGGASCAAIENGKTVDTSMGWGTIPGLVMSTRSGSIDPGVVISLIRDLKMTPEEADKFLSTKSGLVGLTRGLTSDLRDIYSIGIDKKGDYSEEQRKDCKIAFEVYVNRLVGIIGEFIAKLGGIDILCFTDDLGFNMWQLRDTVCERLKFIGMVIDKKKNQETSKGKGQLATSDVAEIHAQESKVKIYVVKNDEEIVIAREASKYF